VSLKARNGVIVSALFEDCSFDSPKNFGMAPLMRTSPSGEILYAQRYTECAEGPCNVLSPSTLMLMLH